MKNIIKIFVCLIFSAVIINCGGGSESKTSPEEVPGTALSGKATCTADPGETVLCGTIYAADGVTPLAGAEVRSTSISKVMTKGVADSNNCYSDSEGNFSCILPAGTTGSHSFVIVFPGLTKTFTDTIEDGVNSYGDITTEASTSAKWVVVPGTWDGVQVLLAQLKGCTLCDSYGNPFVEATMDPADAESSDECIEKGLLVLDDYDSSSPYYVSTYLTGSSFLSDSALFINCDALSDDWGDGDSLVTAVKTFNNNGGHVYFSDLSDAWLTESFPGAINFGGNFTSSGTVTGNVLHSGLAGYIGSTINIEFDLSVWTVIDNVESFVTKYIEADVTSVSSSVTGVRPITVGWQPNSSSGRVFYTSYHVEGASSGSAQEKALKYLILNVDYLSK